ncbi:zinc finger transcription factor ace1 [Pyrenophora seminiperda CCB06]|uniref:Zinc finger transcription factor ace1 n=1 Tax=Pyrenophora seminiperda CCB06 TaxID=1302712 RepID=A0A3M7LX51_9PLEO|nr:zinc finger transcription factor ace1 [Pyrenophora seminiperda CCB06]
MCQHTPIDKVTIPCMYDDDEGITTVPVPGRRCPACLERGDTVWVIPGKCCPQCGTPVN